MRKWLSGIAFLIVLALLLTLILIPQFGTRLSFLAAEISQAREIATPPADLSDAQARWAAHPVHHYRLIVQHSLLTYPFVNCMQDSEVLNERVVLTFGDSCSTDEYLHRFAPLRRTITELFAQFRKETTTIRYREQGNPRCLYFLGVDIAYASFGNPISAVYSWAQASPLSLGLQTYKALYGDAPNAMTCSSDADPREPNMAITLQPLS